MSIAQSYEFLFRYWGVTHLFTFYAIIRLQERQVVAGGIWP